MERKTEYRIGLGMSVILMIFATICDAFTLIPLVGDFVGPIFWIVIGIYFYFKRIPYFDGKKFASIAISFISEMIPAVQELPMLLAGIIAVLFIIRVEDKTGKDLLRPISGGTRLPKLQRNPLNRQPGIRPPNQQE